tara:strand:+ start:63 stop:353 length:291 start_codon:yes stop_codon:yes gene_type:complete
MNIKEQITELIYKNSKDINEGVLIDFKTITLLIEQIVAISVTRCCCKLKDKESQAFEDWIDFEGYRDEYNDLLSNGFAYDIGLLHKKHNEFLKHSL